MDPRLKPLPAYVEELAEQIRGLKRQLARLGPAGSDGTPGATGAAGAVGPAGTPGVDADPILSWTSR